MLDISASRCVFVVTLSGAGHVCGAGVELGTRPARDVQAMGRWHRTVPSAARQPVRHVVRVPHGTSVLGEFTALTVTLDYLPLETDRSGRK